jgi:hypothetical protein
MVVKLWRARCQAERLVQARGRRSLFPRLWTRSVLTEPSLGFFRSANYLVFLDESGYFISHRVLSERSSRGMIVGIPLTIRLPLLFLEPRSNAPDWAYTHPTSKCSSGQKVVQRNGFGPINPLTSRMNLRASCTAATTAEAVTSTSPG